MEWIFKVFVIIFGFLEAVVYVLGNFDEISNFLRIFGNNSQKCINPAL